MSDSPLVTYSRMIRLSHSIFAMPFALAAAVLAAREVTITWQQVVLIVLCMVLARSTAMGFNRIVDRDIDAKNPRTASRELPSGQISLTSAWVFTLGSAALFVLCTAGLHPLALMLSPVAVAIVWGYSLTKRFTALCHLVLGVALALAPLGVWIGLTGTVTAIPVVLSLAVGTWVAGFDILYSCQDEAFDAEHGPHSIPSALGLRGAMVVSAVLHVTTVGLLLALPSFTALGPAYLVGVALIGVVLLYEHWIVRPDDLSRIDKAFFDLNGYVSLLFFVFVAAGTYWS
ncbi:MAG: putative 4-hydroxybenzoate polyprenyltransferase [Myxococcales bacterium]|nr:putative 4-hydroxybenzoate polyprenyltransferase [Myxococcales bacterium]